MTLTPAVSKGLLDVLIRAGLVAILAVVCYQIFFPFLNLLLWSMILAVMLYPLHKWFKRKLGDREIESLLYSAQHYVRLKDQYLAAAP